MRTLEVRRHVMRRKPSEHLSQDGINLARLVGEESEPPALVATSNIPRAVETAIAMGFEVQETLEALGYLPDEVYREVGWPNPFTVVARAVAASTEVAGFAREQARLWRSIVERVGDGERALIVTHGSFVELGAVASVWQVDHGVWGEPIGYGEGVRLSFESSLVGWELLRLPDPLHLVEN